MPRLRYYAAVVWFVLDLILHARRDTRAGWPVDL